jgi:hypothetical protein
MSENFIVRLVIKRRSDCAAKRAILMCMFGETAIRFTPPVKRQRSFPITTTITTKAILQSRFCRTEACRNCEFV